MGATGRGAVGGKQIGFGDEGIVAFVVDPGMDEPAVHSPGTVPCRTRAEVVKLTSGRKSPAAAPEEMKRSRNREKKDVSSF